MCSLDLASPPGSCVPDPELASTLRFERSPGGVPEVDPEWVRDRYCNAHIVDVREPEERLGAFGAIAQAEPIPLAELAAAASAWDPNEPIVLVCRSGRRSARAARILEDLGFSRAASMTGGMLSWRDRGYPAVHPNAPTAAGTEPALESPAPAPPLTAEAIAAHLGDSSSSRWVKVAALLLQGTQACVDGRDRRPVVGTPGGDAGELLLALAAAERVRERPLEPAEVGHILDAYLDAFGRFYVHSDEHALHALGEHLRADPRFASALEGESIEAVERLVRRPPRALEGPLLEALGEPAHVGCGHLRLIVSHPDEYGVRLGLSMTLLRAVFSRLWSGDAIDFVVLEGEHREGAVVNVVIEGSVHAYTRIPTVAPRIGGEELFIHHPQVVAYLREQNASFLFEVDPWLLGSPGGQEPSERQREYLQTLERMGAEQLGATLRHLAARLPIYEARISETGVRVEGPSEVEESR
ncbi:MAG: rhodanese-like domain-containing protein [Myxococcales bacterium]|nr:rhodanese-like domain-containing protein [Myxococcales bacterium]